MRFYQGDCKWISEKTLLRTAVIGTRGRPKHVVLALALIVSVSYQTLLLGCRYRPWSRELGGVATRSCGSCGNGLSHSDGARKSDGEGARIALGVGANAPLTDERLALVARGVGEELDGDNSCWACC